MDGEELHRRFPGYRLPDQIRCLYQPDGGFLLPERCDVAHIEQALAHGAEVRFREPVTSWEVKNGGVRVHTPLGRYEAGRLVICAGPWASKLVPELDGLAVPERQVLASLVSRLAGRTVLAITHREAVAAAMDRTIRLDAGRVIDDDQQAAREAVPA